ncbi:hypothetical protein GQ42DRAFT_152844 [Ramicandelaber brevisporus]|nr:hypothetical protein GQ42DRAFT_152844 [Ramicandelaber brevisporus]
MIARLLSRASAVSRVSELANAAVSQQTRVLSTTVPTENRRLQFQRRLKTLQEEYDDPAPNMTSGDIPYYGQLFYRRIREYRFLLRKAKYEMPLLEQYKKEFKPPTHVIHTRASSDKSDTVTANLQVYNDYTLPSTSTAPAAAPAAAAKASNVGESIPVAKSDSVNQFVTFRESVYLGEPEFFGNRIVTLFLHTKHLNLTASQLRKFLLLTTHANLCKYDADKGIVRMRSYRFPTAAENKQHLVSVLDTLLKEVRDPKADKFEDVELKQQNVPNRMKKKNKLNKLHFPKEWLPDTPATSASATATAATAATAATVNA